MVKTVSVAELGHGQASRAVRDSEQEPVLISRENKPAAWIVSSSALAEIAAARGGEPDVYQRAIELLALDLYRREVLSLERAAKLAGMSLGEFIDLAGSLHIPVLWEPAGGIRQEVDRFAALLHPSAAQE